MSKRRNILLWLLAGLILTAGFLFFKGQQSPEEMTARQKLDDVLGNHSEGSLPPDPIQPSLPQDFPPLPGPNPHSIFGFSLPMPDTGVEIQETAERYTLRIPLADPQDAESIKLKVRPHHIEVAGQTGSQKGGASFSSSFMQSFTTSDEVRPDQIRRKTEKKGDQMEMVITIPKKHPGHNSPNSTQPPDAQANNHALEIEPEEIGPMPDLNSIPWPNSEPRRI